MDKLKVLIIDGSVIYRKYFTEIINRTEHGMVEHATSDKDIALEWLRHDRIDVVMLDIHILDRVGTALLEKMKAEQPQAEIVILCGKCSDYAEFILECLGAGAIDFIAKPAEKSFDEAAAALRNKIQDLFTQIKVRQYSSGNAHLSREELVNSLPEKGREKTNVRKSEQPHWMQPEVVLIASSTGGPTALSQILRDLPLDFSTPVLIVQHMPPEFTGTLAKSFNEKFTFDVREGRDGDLVEKGRILIAPGGMHMEVAAEGIDKRICLVDSPSVNGVKPSADVLFASAAKAYNGKSVLAIVLTGMGNDGTRGIQALKSACHCYCITQSETSCTVYGMPKCVVEAGLSDEVAPLNTMAARIYQFARGSGVAGHE